jgi:hypothetical protein
MTCKQKEVYNQICELKRIRAKGQLKQTCKVLARLKLIKPDPDTDNEDDYVLAGKALSIPFYEKLPDKKSILKAITDEHAKQPEFKPKQVQATSTPPTAIYSNTSREQHVSKWISAPIAVESKAYVKVRCLADWQMEFIMTNHERYNAQELSEKIGGNELSVKLFCQANVVEPLPMSKKKKAFYDHQKVKS